MDASFRKPAIIGSTGQLGHDLVREFGGAGVAVTGLGHEAISIESAQSVESALRACDPDIVVNTASFHNVPLCETRQPDAVAVNAVGVRNLAEACRKRGIPFVTFSTDYVFDGTKGSPYAEDDEPHPLNVYGVTKLAGEMLAVSAWEQTYVVRTSGLFGVKGSKTKGYTFIDRVLAQARAGEEIKVVTDMTFSPSYTAHVAHALRSIIENGAFGTYHVTNAGYCSWFEFATEALRQAGLAATITPILSSDWPSAVRRPVNSSLAHARLRAEGLPDLPPWQTGIAEYLEARESAPSGVSQPGP